MPHMIAAEHMSFVNALRFGTTRTQATIAAALASIGSTPAFLVFTMTGDGVWTLSSNLTTPTNVFAYIPPGVTVNIPAGVTWTCNGTIIGYGSWKVGAGTVVKSAVGPVNESSNILCEAFTLRHDGVGTAWSYLGTTGAKGIRMFLDDGAGANAGCGIQISNNESVVNSSWQMRTNVTSGDYVIARPGSGAIVTVNNNGIGVGGVSATGSIQLSNDIAIKTTTTTWQVSSDPRLKNVLGDYTEGMDLLRALPNAKRFTYNGKGNMPVTSDVHVSMLANEVQAVKPEWVSSYPGKLEPNDAETTNILMLNISDMFYVLRNALIEHDSRIAALETP